MNRRTLLSLALPALVSTGFLTACATGARGDGPSQAGIQRFSGRWDFHFETSSFVTLAGDGPYWLAADGDVWPQLTAPFQATGSPWGQLDIVVEGRLSPPGRYGHMGAYQRELQVTRVISSRLAQARGS
ncbi:MAG: hypothetical protein AB7O04_07495 [Hyphomonadaceae bacterium]